MEVSGENQKFLKSFFLFSVFTSQLETKGILFTTLCYPADLQVYKLNVRQYTHTHIHTGSASRGIHTQTCTLTHTHTLTHTYTHNFILTLIIELK